MAEAEQRFNALKTPADSSGIPLVKEGVPVAAPKKRKLRIPAAKK